MAGASVNHLGLCVADLKRSRRFYGQALGFETVRSLQAPDSVCSTLFGVARPVGLAALYLTNGGFVLELLQFERPGNPPARDRPFNEPGLTQKSVTTADLAATLALVPTPGGQVAEDTDVGAAVMVRDPDGQVLELLPARAG